MGKREVINLNGSLYLFFIFYLIWFVLPLLLLLIIISKSHNTLEKNNFQMYALHHLQAKRVKLHAECWPKEIQWLNLKKANARPIILLVKMIRFQKY